MTLGQKHLHKILDQIASNGGEVTPEQQAELESLANEIDKLHKIILTNQDAFGVPRINKVIKVKNKKS